MKAIILGRENHVDIICIPPHKVTKCYAWIKLSWDTLKHSTAKKLKTRASGHRLPNWRTIRQKYKRAATGEIAANYFRATGLFLCDKNIFRPHDFPLVSGDTDVAPVNHRSLVNTSDQP